MCYTVEVKYDAAHPSGREAVTDAGRGSGLYPGVPNQYPE